DDGCKEIRNNAILESANMIASQKPGLTASSVAGKFKKSCYTTAVMRMIWLESIFPLASHIPVSRDVR
ncbi:5885_t:CDS:2, partial [Funneliformis geosporum]